MRAGSVKRVVTKTITALMIDAISSISFVNLGKERVEEERVGRTCHRTAVEDDIPRDVVNCWRPVPCSSHNEGKGQKEATREREEQDRDEVDDADFVGHYDERCGVSGGEGGWKD